MHRLLTKSKRLCRPKPFPVIYLHTMTCKSQDKKILHRSWGGDSMGKVLRTLMLRTREQIPRTYIQHSHTHL